MILSDFMKNKIPVFGVVSTLIVMSMLAGISGAQTTTSVINGALSLVDLNVTPIPVVAGSNVVISFGLYNSYDEILQAVDLQLQATNPILSVSPSSTYFVDTISQGRYSGFGFGIFTYTLHIPSTLPAGEYTIDVVANYQGATSSASTATIVPGQSVMPINIYVYGNPQIALNLYPQGQIIPGHDFTATLSAINSGTDTARNVTVQILNSTYFAADGPNTFSYGILAPGSSASSTATIFTNQNIPGGQNYLKTKISYRTNLGANVSNLVNVPINILQNTADFVVTNVIGNVTAGATYVPISFTVKNTGNEEATSISFSLQTIYPVTPASPDVYVASIAPGQSANLTFYVDADSHGNTGQYPVTLYAQWRQPNGATNQQYTGSSDYFMQIQGRGGTPTASFNWSYVAVAVVLVVVVVVGARMAKRRKGLKGKQQK